MYVILKKVETVREIYGPFISKDTAEATKKRLQTSSSAKLVVRKVIDTDEL